MHPIFQGGSGLFEVIPQKMSGIWPAQFGEGLGFDLADPLPGHPELPTDFFERADLSVIETEAQTNHVLLSFDEEDPVMVDL